MADKNSELEKLAAELTKAASERGALSDPSSQGNSGVLTSGDLEREGAAPPQSSSKVVEVRDAEIKRLERGAEELRRLLAKTRKENSSLEEQLKSVTGVPTGYLRPPMSRITARWHWHCFGLVPSLVDATFTRPLKFRGL